jgi:hypothetical protein
MEAKLSSPMTEFFPSGAHQLRTLLLRPGVGITSGCRCITAACPDTRLLEQEERGLAIDLEGVFLVDREELPMS